MIINPNTERLLELLKELEVLYDSGSISKEEYDCLHFILNHAYSSVDSDKKLLADKSTRTIFNN